MDTERHSHIQFRRHRNRPEPSQPMPRLELPVGWIGAEFFVRTDMPISERFAAEEIASFRRARLPQIGNHPSLLLEVFLRPNDGRRRDAAKGAVVSAPEQNGTDAPQTNRYRLQRTRPVRWFQRSVVDLLDGADEWLVALLNSSVRRSPPIAEANLVSRTNRF